ncbi:MAG: asparaginase [Methylomarinum sp.]|nr:asparaginase [Methylomarinum sp.]
MSNILLVFTGGTIGSTAVNGTINTSSKQAYKLINLFEQCYADAKNQNFTTIQPVAILSENLFPSVWETLINAIEAENISQYDGIIVTHGTDTLAFTAAALSLYFNAIKIPLLLVSSDYPLEHPQANGLSHFICAIEFIKQRKEAGVYVPYKNQNSETLIHLGSRIASCLQLSGDFISVQSKAYLSFKDNVFHQQNNINKLDCKQTQLAPRFSSRILLIKPYPGLNYEHFSLDQVDVALHDLYHSGTACSSDAWGENHTLVKFIQTCKQKNITLFMAPAIKNQDSYDSTQVLIEQGARMIWNMSLEVAYVKLLLAYGNFNTNDEITQFLSNNIASEIIH